MITSAKTRQVAWPVDRNTVVRWMFDVEAQGCSFRLEGPAVRLVKGRALPSADLAFFQEHGAETRDVLRSIPPAVM